MYCFDLCRVQMCHVFVIDTSKEGHRQLLNSKCLTIEDKTVLEGNPHDLMEPCVMLFIILAIHNYIIYDPNLTITAVQDLVHHSLEDVLGTD